MSDDREELEYEEEIQETEPSIENEQPTENEQEPELENDEVVSKAKKYGHLSKEDWVAAGKDPKLWKSPEEFNKTGEVIEQLYSLKKKVDQRDREIQSLVEYQQRTAQREYERAKQELEARLTASKNDMDMDGVSHYTKELVKLQDNEQLTKANQMQAAQKAAQEAFIERNEHWFNDRNPDLMNRAIELDNELKVRYPSASYEELAELIEAKMIKEHPERILGQTRSGRPNTSQSSVNKTAAVKTHTLKNLSQEHRDTYNVYKRINPKITEADFIQKLKNDGEI